VTDTITQEIFDHLVGLAELDLTPQEADYLRRELNGQLKSIRALEAIEVDARVPITSHGVPYTPDTRPPLREDRITPSGESDAILAQAPEREDRYIVVPDIPVEELE
jgi:aspartyl-tRNA(Asn)/glutamyl-tRNA(Gln) amidotransferase subunit C